MNLLDTCTKCGGEFVSSVARLKHNMHTCNPCARIIPPHLLVDAVCETCSAPFKMARRYLKRKSRFCSRECARLNAQNRRWPAFYEKFAANFWKRVDQSGGPDACWPWTMHLNPHGYGRVMQHGVFTGAHRIAYSLTNGEISADVVICHRCDNPPCCNPAHLFAATHQDNVADRVAKGRSATGDRHGMSLKARAARATTEAST